MIDARYFWTNILLLAAGTYAIRCSWVALAGRYSVSPRARAVFPYIPAAVLPALVAPAVFLHRGQVASLHGKERLLAALVATVVCFFTRNTLLTILAGLAVNWLARSVMGTW